MTYDGNLGMNDIQNYLDNHNDADLGNVPTTPQDETPHKDGLFGRNYDGFDAAQLGRRGTDVLNDPLNNPNQPHGDHFDVVERDPLTQNTYHNRINL